MGLLANLEGFIRGPFWASKIERYFWSSLDRTRKEKIEFQVQYQVHINIIPYVAA